MLVVLLGAATFIGGCTFLIDFDDMPPLADGGGSGDAEAGVKDTGIDGNDAKPTEGGPIAFPPPCDPTFPLNKVTCNPSFPRPNCASNTSIFATYPTNRGEDLVTCNGGSTPTCVQHCPFGCAVMPQGYPDMCDDCDGRPDGTYCVKDLRGPDGRLLGLAVDCKNGRAVMGHVCGVDRCATKCPRTDPKPSCCI